mgnify:CR=1 FL=1
MTTLHRRPTTANAITRRRLLAPCAAAAGLWATGLAAPAWAQAAGWPNKPIRLIHPWAAGGGGDIAARLLAERMQAELGQPVLVENRPGAGGNIGAQLAARHPADGHTIMTTAGGFAIPPALFSALGYDPLKDFVPVTKMAIAPLLVLVRADSPLRSMADLVALARKDPKGVSYASFGTGSPSHLIGERINRQAGIIAQPDVKVRLFELAMFPVQPATTPEQWAAMLRSDVQAWGDLVRRAGITPNLGRRWTKRSTPRR